MADKAGIVPQEGAEEHEERLARQAALPRLEREMTALLEAMINDFQEETADDELREHLGMLRSLLIAQVSAYLGHAIERMQALSSSISPMYADEVGPAGPVPTTMRGLVEGGTMTPGQAARLASYVSDRRTILVFGDRATGKSTLLNALLEIVPVDERFVSIEHLDNLPALKDRSFCVRLSVDDATDVEALFAKALKMHPSRIVIGEVQTDEILYFFRALGRDDKIGGFCTLRADSVHRAVAKLARQMELYVDAPEAKALVGQARPVLVYMRSDEKGLPRLAAMWSIEGVDGDGEILLSEDAASASGSPAG